MPDVPLLLKEALYRTNHEYAENDLPKSVWLLIQPISLIDTSANNPEPTNEPIPEKKKNSPMIALCMDLGAAEYANSRPVLKEKKMLLEELRNNISLFWFRLAGLFFLRLVEVGLQL